MLRNRHVSPIMVDGKPHSVVGAMLDVSGFVGGDRDLAQSMQCELAKPVQRRVQARPPTLRPLLCHEHAQAVCKQQT